MTKIEPYLSPRRLIPAFLAMVFASRCYSIFPVMFVYFAVENLKMIMFFSDSHLGLTFIQFSIYLNKNNIYL